jgi:hypothetical protein
MEPSQESIALKNAKNARNAIKLAAMLATREIAVHAPFAAASITLRSPLK